MGDDGDDEAVLGFFEAASEFERMTKVKMMDDATLLNTYRALSNPKLQPSRWLDLVEEEVRTRGLRPAN